MSIRSAVEPGVAHDDDGDVVAGCPVLVLDGCGRDLVGDRGSVPVAEGAREFHEPPLAEEVTIAPALDHAVGVEQQRVPRAQGGGRLVQRRGREGAEDGAEPSERHRIAVPPYHQRAGVPGQAIVMRAGSPAGSRIRRERPYRPAWCGAGAARR